MIKTTFSPMSLAEIDRSCIYFGWVVLRTHTISLFNLSDVVEWRIMSTLFIQPSTTPLSIYITIKSMGIDKWSIMVSLSLVTHTPTNSFILESVSHWIDRGQLSSIHELNWHDDLLWYCTSSLHNCPMWSIKREVEFSEFQIRWRYMVSSHNIYMCGYENWH